LQFVPDVSWIGYSIARKWLDYENRSQLLSSSNNP
jgi:hypothetical protein